jgi:hypothetical protein
MFYMIRVINIDTEQAGSGGNASDFSLEGA